MGRMGRLGAWQEQAPGRISSMDEDKREWPCGGLAEAELGKAWYWFLGQGNEACMAHEGTMERELVRSRR
jgi:hypothetical protein